jgi:hypothetical protein
MNHPTTVSVPPGVSPGKKLMPISATPMTTAIKAAAAPIL